MANELSTLPLPAPNVGTRHGGVSDLAQGRLPSWLGAQPVDGF